MSESDKRRDDERDETPEWNTPATEAAPASEGDALPVAVRRVLASDRHLSQRRVFYGQAGADEDELESVDKKATPQ